MRSPYLIICSLMLLTSVLRAETDFWFGPAYQAGDVTYSIGGAGWSRDSGKFIAPDTISELSFPLDGPALQGGFTTRFAGSWEAALSGSVTLSDPSTPSPNSDWDDNGALFIYSESDARLDAYDLDVAVRCWFEDCLDIAIGAGLIYQSQSWTLENLDQWYPPNPEWGHDEVAGLTGSYETETWIPYIELATRGSLRQWHFWGRAIASPFARVNDVDDHKLRYIRATTSARGIAGALEGSIRRDLNRDWFAELRGRLLSFSVSGAEHDTTYDGPYKGKTWEIDHEVTSTQLMLTLAIGLAL